MDYVLEAGKATPYVKMSREEGVVELRGKSNGENALKFYQPLIKKLEIFKEDEKPLSIEMYLEYFNTSSAKCLFDFFRKANELKQNGKAIAVNWYYEEDDIDMMETGEDFQDLIDIDFNLVELSEEDFFSPLRKVS